jgi:hypothetical protein
LNWQLIRVRGLALRTRSTLDRCLPLGWLPLQLGWILHRRLTGIGSTWRSLPLNWTLGYKLSLRRHRALGELVRRTILSLRLTRRGPSWTVTLQTCPPTTRRTMLHRRGHRTTSLLRRSAHR